ncbi:AAA_12 domain-containing protein [Meloidogyne graminicola]|uniref:AAA_12 domain-containing protein n=1 Tax=Meloidogyne graminicola TaxID=189291 RepID=A0A8S9ZTG1_9BILA|nr:AAA_12 domain-containing protein [Meloidogyne graminicola]
MLFCRFFIISKNFVILMRDEVCHISLWRSICLSLLPFEIYESYSNLQSLSFFSRFHRQFNKWSLIPEPFNANVANIDSWSLPYVIQRDCLRWERSLRTEISMSKNRHWLSCPLECLRVFITKGNIKLLLSTKNLSKEQKSSFNVLMATGTSVRLCDTENDINKIRMGFVLSRTESFIEVQLEENTNINYSLFQGKSFIIQKWASKSNIGRLKFLMTRNADWECLPGFKTMLYAYKCDKRINKVIGINSSYSHSINFDHSQQLAIDAVLDMDRPLIAVHGAPGTGKSRLLLECIDILAKQGKRIFLLCNISLIHLYRFLVKYYELTKRTDFILFNGFDEELLNSCIDNVNLRKIFQNKSVRMDITQTNVKEFCERNDWRIACSSGSNSLLDSFLRNKISFDVFMADDAGRINEFDSWHHILTLSSCARLFGDYHNLPSAVQSIEAYNLQFGRSLLQRLNEQFGNEVNYYLSTQYRSNPYIREWPNNIFYKNKSPLNDKTVQNICIGEYLIKEKKDGNNLIKEPLVLVDISLLNGEWNKQMFITQKYGYSYFNWGDALIAAAHLSKLIENGFNPKMLLYITCNDAQRILTEHIICKKNNFLKYFTNITILLPSSLSKNIRRLVIGKPIDSLIGQQPEVIIKSRAFHLPLHYSLELHKKDYNLALWNFEISHAKRQFMAILRKI